MSNGEFHNPYHFVPVTEEIPEAIPLGEQGREREWLYHRTFDRYHEGTRSGRIICRLTTRGPMVIGSGQSGRDRRDDEINRVKPFLRIRKSGAAKTPEPAIPGSTLRGCISAVAEAASNSALRVLHSERYSRRVDIDEVGESVQDFSALGLIVQEGEELRLRPLTMPTLKKAGDNGHFELPVAYRPMFQEARLKAYCYQKHELKDAVSTYEADGRPAFYYAEIEGNESGGYSLQANGEVHGSGGVLKGRHDDILLGSRTVGKPQKDRAPNMVRGLVRTLFTQSRRDEIPPGKKHEIFIPYTPEMEKERTFAISAEALKTFRCLAEARHGENERRIESGTTLRTDLLPLALKGGAPFCDREPAYSLADGDIVFFKASGGEVLEVSISQVWRKPIHGNPTIWDFFNDVSPDLLPMSPSRTRLTLAEAIFGYVEAPATGKAVKDDPSMRALASRIQFGEGRLIDGHEEPVGTDWVPLKILASPKPPCPPFYFRRKSSRKKAAKRKPTPSDCYISKRELRIGQHVPQGRKFYLHHVTHDRPTENYRLEDSYRTADDSERRSLKNEVRLIKENCQFQFSIDFENLSDSELGLLLYALEPTTSFHHKLGMGKPLGLGSVKIDVVAVFHVDRQKRYAANAFKDALQPRFHRHWIRADWGRSNLSLNEHELKAAESGEGLIQPEDKDFPSTIRDGFTAVMQDSIKTALGKVGQPNVANLRPPLAYDQGDPEKETFQWFQNNDRQREEKKRQGLVPLDLGGLVALSKNEPPPKRSG